MSSCAVWIVTSVVLGFYTILVAPDALAPAENTNSPNTDIAKGHDDRLLLFATLDGSLIATEQLTGKIRWKLKDKPVVTMPLDDKEAVLPLFLPDPKDGSLYLLGASREPLKKLPFTIPQLVASSPCRSSDGILYTGKKKDAWFTLEPKTGKKQQISGWNKFSPTCPVHTTDGVYIGQTQYSIIMVDSRNTHRKWNVTFYDYAATPMDKDAMNNYDLLHFSSSSTGRLVTLDRRRGSLLWESDLESPVVSAFLLDPEGLLSVPFTSMANHTLAHLSSHLLMQEQPFQPQSHNMKLYPTLYIGEHSSGLYALPSLVDQNMVTITASEAGPLLLDGPGSPNYPQPYPEYPVPGHSYRTPEGYYKKDPITFQSMADLNYSIIFLGHYNIPDFTPTKLLISGSSMHKKLLTDASDKVPINQPETFNSGRDKIEESGKVTIGVQTDSTVEEESAESNVHVDNAAKYSYNSVKQWINQQENKGLKLTLIILIGCIIAMFWYLQMQVREFQQLSQNGSRSSQKNSSGRHGPITAIAEELPDGTVKVGKITFHPEQLLGKGCEGTFVYRGEFDKRQVAVKRLLPECFTFADREVALLRESDAHPNVVRYFCTEQDRMFRYIALELCQATLHDYVQGKCDTTLIKPLEILRQATAGLAHLHSLDIVHRDIKPQNVLLSTLDVKGEVHAMISDFGLCKKLQVGRVSFSRRSGVTGTDGWIAPEMLNGSERTTCAVDMFSLGCLFYYVLSEGAHPFGESLRRQANILTGEFDLSDLKGTPSQVSLQKPLLTSLISPIPNERPSSAAVLLSPIFWSSATILAFFQDVSDRVEKAELDDPVLQSLESGGRVVVRSHWRLHIHEEVVRDLRRYRSYTGESVRDLLRALRNKKHHYRDLSLEAQETLGAIPHNFTDYWTSRFPLLLVHSWLAMQCVAHETNFNHYYHSSYRYPVRGWDMELASTYSDIAVGAGMEMEQTPMKTLESVFRNGDADGFTYPKSPKRNQRVSFIESNTRRPRYTTKNVENKASEANYNYGSDRRTQNLDPNKNFNNVGLYRNNNPKITVSSSPAKHFKDSNATLDTRNNQEVDVSDIDLTMLDDGRQNFQNRGNSSVSPVQRRRPKNKKLVKKDEPLLWSLPPSDNNPH